MQLILKGKNVEITDWLRQYVEKKVDKLDRYLAADGGLAGAIDRAKPTGTYAVQQFVSFQRVPAQVSHGDIITQKLRRCVPLRELHT